MNNASTELLPNTNVLLSPAHDVLGELLLRMSRVVLHHPQRHSFEDNPTVLYRALEEYFTLASARQKRAAEFCLGEPEVVAMLEFCFEQIEEASLDVQFQAHIEIHSDDDKDAQIKLLIAQAPLVSLEKLREHVRRVVRDYEVAKALNVLLGPGMIEIIQLCGLLNDGLGLPRAPLGTIHTIHLSAAIAALYPANNLRELVGLVAQVVKLNVQDITSRSARERTLLKYYFVAAIYHEWGILDSRHRKLLYVLSRHCLSAAADASESALQRPLSDHLANRLRSAEEEKLIMSVVDPIMAGSYFGEKEHQSRRGSSTSSDVESRERGLFDKSLRRGSAVGASFQKTFTPIQDQDAIVDEIDYRFWADLAS